MVAIFIKLYHCWLIAIYLKVQEEVSLFWYVSVCWGSLFCHAVVYMAVTEFLHLQCNLYLFHVLYFILLSSSHQCLYFCLKTMSNVAMYYLFCMITPLSKVSFLIVTVMTGQSHNASASFFYHPKPNQPRALLLWHPSQPLPVSAKLPACSLLHQEPQEMSLRER